MNIMLSAILSAARPTTLAALANDLLMAEDRTDVMTDREWQVAQDVIAAIRRKLEADHGEDGFEKLIANN